MRPVAVKPVKEPPLDENAPAGLLLERGIDRYRADDYGASSHAFRAAIMTKKLNDAGRALAYWHIFVAEHSLGNQDEAVDALASFVVVAQEVLDTRDRVRYAVDESGDFVDRFDLEDRLARGRALMSAAWLAHSETFGRSSAIPIPTLDNTEVLYFLDAIVPCSFEGHRAISRREVPAKSDGRVEKVTVRCDNDETVDYFFELKD